MTISCSVGPGNEIFVLNKSKMVVVLLANKFSVFANCILAISILQSLRVKAQINL